MSWHPDQRTRLSRWSVGALIVFSAAALAGCGEGRPNVGATYPVKGKVTLPDGKPLARTRVIFEGPVSNESVTETDGSFTIAGGGLPAGDYKVRLQVVESQGSPKHPVLPFPDKYLDEDRSDLRAVVKPEGPNELDFKLTKGDPKVNAGTRPAKDND
jgi:hypothetical protein